MRRKAIGALLAAAMMTVSLAACGGSGSSTAPAAGTNESADTTQAAANEDLSGELVFAIWDNNLMEYIDQNDMVGKFQEHYPNAEIEVEKIKDDSEYLRSSPCWPL